MAWSVFELVDAQTVREGMYTSDDEIALVSVEDFSAISTETVFEKKIMPRSGKVKKETHTKQQKDSTSAEGNFFA